MSETSLFWFLQTHLTFSEILKVSHKIFQSTSAFSLEDLLHMVYFKEERLDVIQKQWSLFQAQSLQKHPRNILTKKELAKIRGKTLHPQTPLALQFLGNPEILKKPTIAILGSRHPTFYGREQTYLFARALAKKGCHILSGGAIGVDSIANAVALQHEGYTCAVLGSGIQHLYPASNYGLFQSMAKSSRGLILSEFSSFEPPQKWHFPRRNHTIACLVDFVLIMEASGTSGSLISASAALDFGIDVGAVPGNLDNVNSVGTNQLIQNGAICVLTPQDILDHIR